MANRPKKSTKSKTVVDDRFQPKDVQTPICLNCDEHNGKVKSFYMSNNSTHIYNACRVPYCKDCLVKFYDEYYKKCGRSDLAMFYLCRKADVFYSTKLFQGAESTSLKLNQSIVSSYFRMLNSIKDNAGFKDNFNESANFLDLEILEDKYKTGKIEITDNDDNVVIAPEAFTEQDEINKKDCIKQLGYDPFFDNTKSEQKFLYNTLLPFLDDATLEDAFKLPIVIELVKSLGQVEKLNKTFNSMMASTENIEENASKLSSLVGSKDKLYRSILAMAKDNGISIQYATNKSQGAGTLSRIVKELEEIGLREAKVNLFDIETSESMKQTADVSNRSLMEQINLQESELWDMISELRELRIKLDKKVDELTEQLRLEKVKNFDLLNIQSQMEEYIKQLENKYNELNKSKYMKADLNS
jgi:hypothetical protein